MTEVQKQWKNVREIIKKDAGELIFNNWLKKLEFIKINGDVYEHSVPTTFLKSWIKNHYLDIIEKAWAKHLDRKEVFVELNIRRPQKFNAPEQKQNLLNNNNQNDATENLLGTELNYKFKFQTLVVGESNKPAVYIARGVVDRLSGKAEDFNPSYIYGSVGLGKTHILQSIAWNILETKQEIKIAYIPADHFMLKFKYSIGDISRPTVREQFSQVQVFLFDDIHMLRGKETSKEFLKIIKFLKENRKVIIITGDSDINSLAIDEKTKSILRSGLPIEVCAMDLKMKIEMLTKLFEEYKSHKKDFEIEKHIIEEVCRRIQDSGRDVEGAFNRITAHYSVTCTNGEKININYVLNWIRDLIDEYKVKRIMIDDIVRQVCLDFNITKQDIISSKRSQNIVWPRQVAMYLCKQLTQRSLPEIGKKFGNRDHTTVLYAIKKVKQQIDKNENMKNIIEKIKNSLT